MRFPAVIEYDALIIKLDNYFAEKENDILKESVLSYVEQQCKHSKLGLNYDQFAHALGLINSKYDT